MDKYTHMKTLVSIGCSHMAGSECDGKGTDTPIQRSKSFPARIAKDINYNYIDYSVPGASNESTFRKLVEFVTENTNYKDYFFLIGITSPYRLELKYSKDNNYVHGTCLDPAIQEQEKKYFPLTSGTMDSIIQEKSMRALKTNLSLWNEELREHQTIVIAYAIQRICISLNLNYFILNTCHELWPNGREKSLAICNNLDWTYYDHPLEREYSYFFRAKEIYKLTNITPYGHHYEEAHVLYSKYLLDKLKSLYKFD